MKSAINWYEIPVSDMNRARKFYSTVLGFELTEMPMPGLPFKYLRFPVEQGEGVGGVLVEGRATNQTPKERWFILTAVKIFQ